MSILRRLNITQLRNLQDVSVSLSPQVNLFYGDNGSGKTSILEAISLLGLGRSFRSHKTRSLIHHQHKELTVFSDIVQSDNNSVETPVGIQKRRDGSSSIRVGGENILSAAILAKQLPLQVINASSFQLIEGSPSQRRQFLDWMVFHVEPQFASLWSGLQKTLKQRNSLLRRDKITYQDLAPWDVEFCSITEKIHLLRTGVFEHFKQLFDTGLQARAVEEKLDVAFAYVPGWDVEQSFADVLKQDFERDRRDGYTHHGPQRADIKILATDKPAVDVLSRGQEKALICAMHIAQARLYQQKTQKNCVFLIDDLLAELDQYHCRQLAGWLAELKGQVLVTGISKDGLMDAWSEQDIDTTVFHVKHGKVETE